MTQPTGGQPPQRLVRAGGGLPRTTRLRLWRKLEILCVSKLDQSQSTLRWFVILAVHIAPWTVHVQVNMSMCQELLLCPSKSSRQNQVFVWSGCRLHMLHLSSSGLGLKQVWLSRKNKQSQSPLLPLPQKEAAPPSERRALHQDILSQAGHLRRLSLPGCLLLLLV